MDKKTLIRRVSTLENWLKEANQSTDQSISIGLIEKLNDLYKQELFEAEAKDLQIKNFPFVLVEEMEISNKDTTVTITKEKIINFYKRHIPTTENHDRNFMLDLNYCLDSISGDTVSFDKKDLVFFKIRNLRKIRDMQAFYVLEGQELLNIKDKDCNKLLAKMISFMLYMENYPVSDYKYISNNGRAMVMAVVNRNKYEDPHSLVIRFVDSDFKISSCSQTRERGDDSIYISSKNIG